MPVKPVRIGHLRGVPGKRVFGALDIMSLPTGARERIPLIIAQGAAPGPCLWVTTGIHGGEHGGLNVLHQVVTARLARALRGTLVAVPALNPAGLRTATRHPYYLVQDPNRLFPEERPARDRDPLSPLESAYATLFEWIRASADYLVDLHNAWTGSLAFIFRDRVWYRGARRKAEAERLYRRTDEMIQALGLTVVNEYPMKKYVRERLHRSVSGATLNVGRIPAVTIELGTGMRPDPGMLAAGVTALQNLMRHAGMLDGEPQPITTTPVLRPPIPVRRQMAPRVPRACVLRHLVRPGDRLQAGDPVAEMRDIYGRPVAGGLLRSEHAGWVLGLTEGVLRYANDPAAVLAIRDDEPMVQPYPE